MLMVTARPTLTYFYFSQFLTQSIYIRTIAPQTGIPSFPKAWNMPVFSEFIFTRLHINMTIYCVLDLTELT